MHFYRGELIKSSTVGWKREAVLGLEHRYYTSTVTQLLASPGPFKSGQTRIELNIVPSLPC